jgi:hypothetical protein
MLHSVAYHIRLTQRAQAPIIKEVVKEEQMKSRRWRRGGDEK